MVIMMKNVQISQELFVALLHYHLSGENEYEEVIEQGLEQKLDAMLRHELYAQYKTAPTEEQREQAAVAAVEIEKAKKEIRQKDTEIDQRSRIAGLFCKAFEKAVLLEPTEENVRAWVECTRMNREELTDTVKEARELAETFSSIADILEQSILPSQGQKEEAV